MKIGKNTHPPSALSLLKPYPQETSIDKAFYSSEYSSTAYRPYVEVAHTGGLVAPEPEPDPVPTLSHDQIDVVIGSTATLSVENLPAGATVTWTSSNSSVASVTSNNGVVVARNAGKAVVTVYIAGYDPFIQFWI